MYKFFQTFQKNQTMQKFCLFSVIFLSSCLLFNPNSIILTLDFSEIDESTREKIQEIGIFFCEEAIDRDCSNPANYETLETFSLNRALREEETVGIRLKEFTNLVHFRVVASPDAPSFFTPNLDPTIFSELLVNPDVPESKTLPFVELKAPVALTLSDEGDSSLFTDVASCENNQFFIVSFVDFLDNNTEIVAKTVDQSGIISDKQILLATPEDLFAEELKIAGDSNCDTLGIGFIRSNLNLQNEGFVEEVLAARIDQLTPVAPGTETLFRQVNGNEENLSFSFGIGGFGATWDEDGNEDGIFGASFFQKANADFLNLEEEIPLVRDENLSLFSVSQAGGAQGVVVFTKDASQISLVDLQNNTETPVAFAIPGNVVFDPQIEFLDEERLLLAWLECIAGEADCTVEGRIINRLGKNASGNFPARNSACAPADAPGGCFQIAGLRLNPFELNLASTPDGAFVASWRVQKLSNNNDVFEIETSFFSPIGPRLNPFSLAAGSSIVEEASVGVSNILQNTPKIAALENGSFLLSWFDFDFDENGAFVSSVARAGVVQNALTDLSAR